MSAMNSTPLNIPQAREAMGKFKKYMHSIGFTEETTYQKF
jgi:hypothetical protein